MRESRACKHLPRWTRTPLSCQWTEAHSTSSSRKSMMEGLLDMPKGKVAPLCAPLLRFSHFLVGGRDGYGQLRPSRGGRRTSSLGQHRGLCAVAERLRPGEHLFAFLDDVRVATSPERSVDAHLILKEEMWRRAKIRFHYG